MTTNSLSYTSKSRYLIAKGKGLGLPLTKRETELVLALMDGHTSGLQLMAALGCGKGTVNFNTNQIYGKTGARNLATLVLMVTGAIECPTALLPVQRTWRRKHYRLDEL